MPALTRWIEGILASLLTLGAIAWAVGIYQMLELSIYNEQFEAAMLAVALALAYVHLPARRGATRDRVPWYDWIAVIASLGAAGYLALRYASIVDIILLRPVDAVAVGAIIIVLLLESLRRATGKVLPLIIIVFIIYALSAGLVPGQFQGSSTDWRKLAAYLTVDINGMLGLPLKIGTTIVVTFILFGNLLSVTGASNWFTELALTVMGRFRGGAAKIAVLASALFGTISGSAVANVVSVGVVTIPLIKRSGYAAHQAGAIEAVASTGGQLMPPVMGASAFLMAEYLQIPYSEVVRVAAVPAVLYYLALFIQIDLGAGRAGIARVPSSDIPPLRAVLPGLYFLLPFVVLLVALFTYNVAPELAALWSALALVAFALALGYRGRRPRLSALLDTVRTAGIGVLDVILITAAAGLVIGALAISGLGFNLTLALVTIGGGNLYLLLILSAVVCIILGMGLPTVGVYVLLATLVAPALVEVGVLPIAAHLYIMYFGMMSMITPPVAIAAYVAAGMAGADPIRTGLEACRLGWSAFVVPFLFVLSPTLILIGPVGEIATAVVTAGLGIWLVSIAVVGYFMRAVPALERLLFAAAGLLALIPAGAFPGGEFTDVAGTVLGAVLIAYEIWNVRRSRRTSMRRA